MSGKRCSCTLVGLLKPRQRIPNSDVFYRLQKKRVLSICLSGQERNFSLELLVRFIWSESACRAGLHSSLKKCNPDELGLHSRESKPLFFAKDMMPIC